MAAIHPVGQLLFREKSARVINLPDTSAQLPMICADDLIWREVARNQTDIVRAC
jgi:hypothetical protein